MENRRRHSIARIFLISIILTSLFSSGLLWFIWATERQQAFETESSKLRDEFIDRQRRQVTREVNAALDFIHFKRRQTEERVRQQLQNRVNEAHAIASHIHSYYQAELSPTELNDMIREALRPIRFLGGRGYFFATDFDGIEQLFADRPEMEGMNLLGIRDTEGRPIIRDMISLARTKGEGFYSYTWTKPNAPGRNYQKLSFIKRFAPADWFIGAGEYLGDMDADIKAEVLERLSQIRFGTDGYLFVLSYDSTMLVHPNQKLVGQRMVTSDLPRLSQLFPRLMEVSAETGSGFYEYVWPKPTGDGRSQKVTYVARLPDWDWLIGAGFHLDDVEAQINSEKERLEAELRHDLLKVGGLLLLAIGAALAIARQISRRISNNLRLFGDFFAEAVDGSNRIDTARIGFSEFETLAENANRMISQRDASEKAARRLESQLQQQQKLEAIGTLAGGIAHDFNNLLAVIFGNLSLLKLKLPDEESNRRYLVRIDDAASRARDLVNQILTFSRRAEVEMKPLDLAVVIREAVAMLRSTIPSSVGLEAHIVAERLLIKADATQMHQVLMNLCTNACQALAEGGRIDILLEKAPQNENPLEAGPALLLQVSDNGPGIADEHLDRIFDPFYSTKETGKGTGLGLSVVHSIVESHQGRILVESGENGTCFRIYLPLLEEQLRRPEETPEMAQLKTGQGTILLVDDENSVVQTQEELLQSLGYCVKSFTDPRQALAEIKEHPDSYDLLITDQTMPGMSGLDLAREVRGLNSALPIILCTGYSATADEAGAQAAGVSLFLMKPISATDLSHALGQLLSARKS